MDIDWGAAVQGVEQAWSSATEFLARASQWCLDCWEVAEPHWNSFIAFISNPWARAFGLAIIVYLTIRVIASVYSGDKQNSQLGPIGIRPHSAQRLDRETFVLPLT